MEGEGLVGLRAEETCFRGDEWDLDLEKEMRQIWERRKEKGKKKRKQNKTLLSHLPQESSPLN